jgi:pyridoxal phosphate enzyme (YggS family)
MMSDNVTRRLVEVKNRIAAALAASGRPENAAELIVVSKTFSAQEVLPVLQAGHRKFGENRVQESQGKWPGLKAQFPDVELHLIGPLQSNKAGEAVALFDVIQTIDRPKIAAAIAKASVASGRTLRCLVQINIGSEPQKAGIAPELADAFIRACIEEHRLNIIGVMCIPPVEEDPAPYFEELRAIASRNNLPEISMGMSGDYETALAHGATMVRVGSAIFGSRPKA